MWLWLCKIPWLLLLQTPPCDAGFRATHDTTILLYYPLPPLPVCNACTSFSLFWGLNRHIDLSRHIQWESCFLKLCVTALYLCYSRENEASLRDCKLTPRNLSAYVTGSEFGLLQQRRLKMRFSYYSLFHQHSQSVNRKVPFVSFRTECVYILILKIIRQGWTMVGCCPHCFKWHQLDHNP